MKHIKVIEKDSWIHITEAKKFESLLVREFSSISHIMSHTICNAYMVNEFLSLVFCLTGVGGVLSVSFAEGEFQAARHDFTISL